MDKESVDIDKYWPQVNTPPRLLEFVQGDEFGRQCGLDGILPTYYGRYTRDFHLRQLYRVMLFREATWALANPILEQIRSLTIPISAIDRYLNVVVRLERLESVRFLLDEFFDYKSTYIWTGALEELMFPIDDRKNKAMGTMIRFVIEHGRLFPGQLADGAGIVDGEFFADAPQSCTRDIQLELGLEAHVKTTDLGRVESTASRNYSEDAMMSLDIKNDDGDERQFLQKCRGLESLQIMLERADVFEWVVEEKQRALELPVSGTGAALKYLLQQGHHQLIHTRT
ncbi:MAG: hypothetical protein J3R72DRAFT_499074 [Linnemannia gamsii]|nr:MAG: hypothetical protein J3R72DRAFT_499074 [Linnemannia gamsii]